MDLDSQLDLEPRDHLEILDLISEYARCFDSGDLEGFSALFTRDGSLATPIGTGTNRDEIHQWAEKRWETLRQEGVSPRHFQTNTQLVQTEPGIVRGTTQLLLIWLNASDGDAQIKGAARYDDEFQNTSEGWKFHRRSIGSTNISTDKTPQSPLSKNAPSKETP